jgi:hypothetical protein
VAIAFSSSAFNDSFFSIEKAISWWETVLEFIITNKKGFIFKILADNLAYG